jgi:hypothetical protein
MSWFLSAELPQPWTPAASRGIRIMTAPGGCLPDLFARHARTFLDD